jgi:hypothetical protein
MLRKFLDAGMLEQELERGWRISDPIFGHYLRRVRPQQAGRRS